MLEVTHGKLDSYFIVVDTPEEKAEWMQEFFAIEKLKVNEGYKRYLELEMADQMQELYDLDRQKKQKMGQKER